MLRIKQNRLLFFGVILLGVILIGMPAVYAQDEPIANEWIGSSDGEISYIADSSDLDEAVGETLGSITGDLVFTPVTPCTIIDTRYGGGGFIPAGVTRSYEVYGSLGGQGGGTCNSPVGEPSAVLLNVVAVDPSGKGNLKIVPFGVDPTSAPGLSVNINSTAGANLANAGIVKTAYNSTHDISISANYTGMHANVVVLGYFSRPEATPLDTYVISTATPMPANTLTYGYSNPCDSGYIVTGGGCTFGSPADVIGSIASSPYPNTNGAVNVNQWRCFGTSSIAQNMYVYAVCRKQYIPGR